MDADSQILNLKQEVKELQAILDKNNLNYHKKNKTLESVNWKINPNWHKQTIEAVKNSQKPGIITYNMET